MKIPTNSFKQALSDLKIPANKILISEEHLTVERTHRYIFYRGFSFFVLVFYRLKEMSDQLDAACKEKIPILNLLKSALQTSPQ